MLACRMIREEVRTIYYFENELAFTESSLTPDAVQVFRRLAGEHYHGIASLRVFRDFTVGSSPAHKYHFQVRFTASVVGRNISIGMSIQSLRHKEHLLPRHLQDERDIVCTCDLIDLAETHSLRIDGPNLLDFVEAYAGTIVAKGIPGELLTCELCQKFKCI